ncbi:CHAT domain-containing protein [Algoriphagus winogradskyi]|uniref:CHAT domain-containing protein n=1 Tax=Algoriphagus winogradskyi TaxID=237017 RepID=A0ABY1NM22_9BACT|nr:CHAT domain-containing protein [Algoriphagus winogradskyi]SMP12838.1 CHAT domain-containing protein [Algoriphagus winogradskyi]
MKPLQYATSLLFVLLSFLVEGQTLDSRIKSLDSLISKDQAAVALKELKQVLSEVVKNKQQEVIPDYLEVYGRALLEIHAYPVAIQMMDDLILGWEKQMPGPIYQKDLWMTAANWYEYLGDTESAYQFELKAFDAAIKSQGVVSDKEKGKIKMNLGAYSINRMDLESAKMHLHEALDFLLKDPDPESVYLTNSYLGNLSYFSSKLDSAEYYYEQCLEAISLLNQTPRNKYYRTALIYNNLSGVQSASGHMSQAIQSMEKVLSNLVFYKDSLSDPAEKNKTLEFYLQAVDNLGGIYKELGNFQKAKNLLEYAHSKKLSSFGLANKEVINSKILLGQLYYEMFEMEDARAILQTGLDGLKQIAGNRDFWEADGWNALARVEDYEGNDELALTYYQRADALYQNVLGGDFDLVYLEFLTNYSKFLAENRNQSLAESTASKAYQYLNTIGNGTSLQLFDQSLSMADVSFISGNYRKAQNLSIEALQILKMHLVNQTERLDSIRVNLKKPQAILLKVKSQYYLETEKSPAFLKSLVSELDEGVEFLERRKTFLESEDDVNLLIQDNKDYFDFLKQLTFELYQKTNDESYVEDLLSLHESGIYQKIRLRLEQNGQLRFANVPIEIFEEEEALKSKLENALNNEVDGVQNYLLANHEWERFVENLRTQYSTYYDFRYASLERSIDKIQESIPNNTSVIRYFFVGTELKALVMKHDQKKLIELEFEGLATILNRLQDNWSDEKQSTADLKQLYDRLWKPLEPYITTEHVLIVPDGLLFNLSFEILTPQRIHRYSELATKSLIASHSFSYHYSTLLFDYGRKSASYESEFVAFAPGFFDVMKESYLREVKDSLTLDRAYLTLLPQPFTKQLVAGISKIFGGRIFTDEKSTVNRFKLEAGKHKIIHIGTHAESNNISPNLSRLFFAKSTNHPEDENSLFVKDIYAMDLSSELSVLIACESGKPSYSPGEGMISLAHAFNYAGSKSMLMGIWKIDEHASSDIAMDFYENLAKGLTKDQALRVAKLNYLSTAESRALAPNFWAGLIVMGSTEPLALEKPVPMYWIVTLILLGLIGSWFVFKLFKNPKG